MAPAHYQTIFEIGLKSFPWARVAHPLFFVVLGLLVILFFKKYPVALVTGVWVTGLASIIFLLALLNFIPKFIKLRSAYVSGRSSIVAGVVEDFHPAPTLGPLRESFRVNGLSFSYYPGAGKPCFDNSPLRHGPIRDGLNVRIYYNQGCIQRVDILQKPALDQQ